MRNFGSMLLPLIFSLNAHSEKISCFEMFSIEAPLLPDKSRLLSQAELESFYKRLSAPTMKVLKDNIDHIKVEDVIDLAQRMPDDSLNDAIQSLMYESYVKSRDSGHLHDPQDIVRLAALEIRRNGVTFRDKSSHSNEDLLAKQIDAQIMGFENSSDRHFSNPEGLATVLGSNAGEHSKFIIKKWVMLASAPSSRQSFRRAAAEKILSYLKLKILILSLT
jgi:hypothetical protein